MKLLKSQEAKVFAVMRNQGIAMETASLTTMEHQTGIGEIPAVKIAGTESYFAFSNMPLCGGRLIFMSPGIEGVVGRRNPVDWNETLRWLKVWCDNVQCELAAPDPWAELEREAEGHGVVPDPDLEGTPFNRGERKKVLKTIHALQALLLSYAQDNEVAQKRVVEGTERLEKALASLDRKTFWWTVVGFVGSTGVSMALAPEQTRAIWGLLKEALEGIVRLAG